MNTFADARYTPGENPVFCYRSQLAVYEEVLYGGCLCSAGWNAAGYPLNVLSNQPTRCDPAAFAEPSSFHLEADGISLDYSWSFTDFAVKEIPAGKEAVLTLTSEIAPVRVRVHTVLDGTPMLTRFWEVENTGSTSCALSRITVMGGPVETIDKARILPANEIERVYSAGYMDSSIWGTEGRFHWRDLGTDLFAIDTRFNRDRYRHPMLFLRNNLTGTILFMQLAYSGGCRFTADVRSSRDEGKISLAYSMEVAGYTPLLILAPGESFTAPEAHIGIVSGDTDTAVQAMHRHIRRSVLTLPEADASACLVGAGMGAEHDMSMATTADFMKQFADMGAEVFIIDAGWACPPGPIDWHGMNGLNRPDPLRYPDNGLKKLRDICHKLGMKFGMWLEIERLGERTPVFAEHPEWRALDRFGHRNSGLLDLTVPEAAAWAEEEAARVIEEYGLELFRVDYNLDPQQYFAMRDVCGSGRAECLALRHFDIVGKMYRNLKRRFPDVIFENCAGGGGRTDLAQMKAFNHTWASDWQKSPGSVTVTHGMTMALPPERVDRLFAGMGCHATGSLDLHMRNTMLGHMSLNVIRPADTEDNPEALEFIRHSVQLYKDKIRPILPDCLAWHSTPDTYENEKNGFISMEISSPDRSRGAAVLFTTALSGRKEMTFRPRGIDPGKNYRVTMDNLRTDFTVKGAELWNSGIRIVIPGALSSELILYEAED